MMNPEVAPVSRPPELEHDALEDDRVETMLEWFRENYEDPANQLPYESASGGYHWLWGGPYDALEELPSAFPEATEKEIKAAVERLESSGTVEWTVSSRRIGPMPELGDEYDGSDERKVPLRDDRHRSTIVETTLLPQRKFDWSVHVTFVPVSTNLDLSEVATLGFEVGEFGRDDYTFESLRHLVSTLVADHLTNIRAGDRLDTNEAYEWLQSLDDDADVFVDDGVIVHHSPPEWLQLRELFKHGAAGGVAFISNSPGHYTGVVLMYGGSLLFFRLVKNLNFVQDAYFEKWVKKIKKGK